MLSEDQISITSCKLHEAIKGLSTLEAIAILEVTKMTLINSKNIK